MLDLAQREGSQASLAFAHNAQSQMRWFRGDLVGAEEHFARLSGFREAAGYVQSPGVHVYALAAASLNAWIMGRSEKARKRVAHVSPR